MINNNPVKRVFGLDVFRATAILIVLFTHGKGLSGNAFHFMPKIPLVDGVELFFVLSGFLIGGILINTVEQEKRFDVKKLLIFWKRRWFRTLPTYYLVLIINIILTTTGLISSDIKQFNFRYFIFCQNFSKGFYDFFWESWSLSVEEWFYISMPILIYFFLRFLSVKKALLLSICILLIIPLMYRIFISNLKVDSFWWDVEFRKVVLTRLDAINYGVLAAFIKFYFPHFWFKYRTWLFCLGLVLLCFPLFLTIEVNSFFFKTFYFIIISIGAMMLLPLADSIKECRYKYIGVVFTFFSKISYSLYLLNLGVVISFITFNFEIQTTTHHVIAYYSYWFIVIVLSWFTYTYFENPIMKLRDKY